MQRSRSIQLKGLEINPVQEVGDAWDVADRCFVHLPAVDAGEGIFAVNVQDGTPSVVLSLAGASDDVASATYRDAHLVVLLSQFLPDVLCKRADDSANEAGEDGEYLDVAESLLCARALVNLVNDDLSDGEESVTDCCRHGARQYLVR